MKMFQQNVLELIILFLFIGLTTQCTEIKWLINKPVVVDTFPVAIKTQLFPQNLTVSSSFDKTQTIAIPPSTINDKFHIIWLKSGIPSKEDSIQFDLVSNQKNQTICNTDKTIQFQKSIDISKLNSISLLYSLNSDQGKSQLYVDCTGDSDITINEGECRLKLDVFYKNEKYCDFIKNTKVTNWNDFKLNLPTNLDKIQSWRMNLQQPIGCKDFSGYMFVVKVSDTNGIFNTFDISLSNIYFQFYFIIEFILNHINNIFKTV